MANLRKAWLELKKKESAKNIDFVQQSATECTWQDGLEKWLVGRLEVFFPGYRNRSKIAADISLWILTLSWQTGAKFLGVRAVVEVPDHLIEWNTEALDSIIHLARANKTRVLLYKQPHRPSKGPFYHNLEKYDRYFLGLQKKS